MIETGPKMAKRGVASAEDLFPDQLLMSFSLHHGIGMQQSRKKGLQAFDRALGTARQVDDQAVFSETGLSPGQHGKRGAVLAVFADCLSDAGNFFVQGPAYCRS